MQVLYDRCCGLDIHKKRVNACLILSDPQQGRQKERQTFQTTTADLRRLATWLATAGCTQVAMVSIATLFWFKPTLGARLQGRAYAAVRARTRPGQTLFA